jgi:hypothetical protein
VGLRLVVVVILEVVILGSPVELGVKDGRLWPGEQGFLG